ncbi:MAG: ABC transporter ATP-binding protein [Lachnospiraceae bacterium]|jgi:energy-coupling factor transporter ATP-binding protein EcfA2
MGIIKIEDLTFSYPAEKGKISLNNISIEIEKGEFVCICGRSGSGKTTLLRHLKPALMPHGERSGNILYKGKHFDEFSEFEKASEIGFVMQDPEHQIVTDKVWHELAFGLESLGRDTESIRLAVAEMASYFGIESWFYKDTNELSGGQKQLINLASVMAMQPEVIILDEPTSQLDPIAASDFINTLKKLNSDLGITVIISEHRLEELFAYSDRIALMEEGRIISFASPEDTALFLYREKNDMFETLPAPARIFLASDRALNNKTVPLTVRGGRNWIEKKLDASFFKQKESIDTKNKMECSFDAEPAVELSNVWFRYEKNGPDVLCGMDMKIPQGIVFSVTGGNGTGKSTLLKTICGLIRPYRGTARLFGKKIEKYSRKELFGTTAALLPQNPESLFVCKTVKEELLEMEKNEEAVMNTASLCEITGILENHPYDISGGEQQRVALAKVLMSKPRILLLDEPTKGMDCFFKKAFAEIIYDLKKKGTTIIMVSHDIEFCAMYSDIAALCFNGQILSVNEPSAFFAGNSFYTTAANRMCRRVLPDVVTVDSAVKKLREIICTK